LQGRQDARQVSIRGLARALGRYSTNEGLQVSIRGLARALGRYSTNEGAAGLDTRPRKLGRYSTGGG